jgi:hypothetical protein
MTAIKGILIVFIINFIVQYFLMSSLVSFSIYDTHNSMPKLYLAAFIGFVAVFIDFMMHDFRYNVFSLHAYIFLGLILSLITYLYRTHKFVSDKDYLKEMLDSHSSSLLMSKGILKYTDNYHVTRLAKNIIQTKTDDINYIKEILQKLEGM